MYHTGLDPFTMQQVYVAKTHEEKAMQRALLQCHIRRNWPLIRKALRLADREDLIGTGKGCLVPPDTRPEFTANAKKGKPGGANNQPGERGNARQGERSYGSKRAFDRRGRG